MPKSVIFYFEDRAPITVPFVNQETIDAFVDVMPDLYTYKIVPFTGEEPEESS